MNPSRLKPKEQGDKGFSLIEVLLALAILVIAVEVLFSSQLSGLQTSKVASQRSQAVFLAQAKIEEARTKDLTGGLPPVVLEDYSSIPNYSSFWRNTTYSFIDSSDPQSLIQINVTVKWKAPSKSEQTVTMATYRGQ